MHIIALFHSYYIETFCYRYLVTPICYNLLQVNMSTVIEKVGRQAFYTFSNKSAMTVSKFQENFEKLKSLANQLTAADVNLNLDKLKLVRYKDRSPPVTYINIYEDSYVTIGIFVLKPGEKLPLHDHPQMYGILKVIAGTARIQSYTVVKQTLPSAANIFSLFDKFPYRLSAIKLQEEIVNEQSHACYLTPEERNLHEIHSVGGYAAFLDILSPPYDSSDEGERTCHYYKEEKVKCADETGMTTLVTIQSPPEYWNDTAVYEGPRIRFENGEIN